MSESHELEERWATRVSNTSGDERSEAVDEGSLPQRDFVSVVRGRFSQFWRCCKNSCEVEMGDIQTERAAEAVLPLADQNPLSSYQDLMYHVCATRYSGKSDTPITLLKIMHLVGYSLFCALAFTFCVRNMKHLALNFLAQEEQLDRFIGLASSAMGCVAKMHFMYFLSFSWDRLSSILPLLVITEKEGRLLKHGKYHVKVIGKGLGVASIILALVDVFFFFYNFDSWSFEEFFRVHSFYLVGDVAIWTPSTFGNHTMELWETIYHGPYKNIYTILGTCSAISNFAGLLNQYMLQDIILLVTLSMYWRILILVETLGQEDTDLEEKWKQYQNTKATSNAINETLGLIIPMSHAYNMLLASYSLLNGFKRKKYIGSIALGLQVVKIVYMYNLASRTSQKNKNIRQWVKRICTEHEEVIIGGKKLNKFVLLDDVTTDAIGLGNDESFVDQSFLAKFVGYVSGVFLLLAGEHTRDCKVGSTN